VSVLQIFVTCDLLSLQITKLTQSCTVAPFAALCLKLRVTCDDHTCMLELKSRCPVILLGVAALHSGLALVFFLRQRCTQAESRKPSFVQNKSRSWNLKFTRKKYWRQFELRSEMRKQYVASKWRGQSHIIKGKRPRGTSPLFFTAYRKFGGDIFSEIYLDHIVRV
jgi:hypothetical protein